MAKRNCGIYQVVGIRGQSASIIKPMGLIELAEGDNVADELIETFTVLPDVKCSVYHCNIVDNYLMSSKTQPLMYASTCWSTNFVNKCFYQIYLYFTNETPVNTSKDLINNILNGKFTMEVKMDGTSKRLDIDIPNYKGEKHFIKQFENFVKSEGMIEMVNDLMNQEKEKMMQKLDDEYTIPTNRISLSEYKVDD